MVLQGVRGRSAPRMGRESTPGDEEGTLHKEIGERVNIPGDEGGRVLQGMRKSTLGDKRESALGEEGECSRGYQREKCFRE